MTVDSQLVENTQCLLKVVLCKMDARGRERYARSVIRVWTVPKLNQSMDAAMKAAKNDEGLQTERSMPPKRD